MPVDKCILGNTGIEACRIGLGSWGLGGIYYGKVERDEGVKIVRTYIDAGGDHIDSAYSYHCAEDIIGQAIQPYDREKLVLCSKSYAGCFRDDLPKLRKELETSLHSLGTDYLDTYMIHGAPSDRGRMEALLDEYEKLKDEGRIRSVGVSIPGPKVTDESVELARQYIQTGRVDVIQVAYSVVRQKLGQVFAEAEANGVAVIARWVLESGMLGGRYKPGHAFTWPDTRMRYRDHERNAILTATQQIGSDLPEGFASPAEVAIAFVLHDSRITAMFLGAVRVSQVKRNLSLDKLPPLPQAYRAKLVAEYEPRNDQFNPTAEFENVPSVRPDPPTASEAQPKVHVRRSSPIKR